MTTPSLYKTKRRGSGKGQLRNAPRIQICEPCLIRALSGFSGCTESQCAWQALRESLSYVYGTVKDAETLEPRSSVWTAIRRSLPLPTAEASDNA
jgi:hypothetical protein